ncbi:hypothetical protein AWB77_01465 [Caballeronia fortuita]|uniref:Uncharacterized protein n=1 Tax=Caballeronia fortuita TaxID=1777138 RepID=A0A158A7T9_9BURK|nr:hypothetical protein [Caballeronia fortuita]SAK53779.1 hypothetical protein AWB77_01465 [Caballeronia fortuita]
MASSPLLGPENSEDGRQSRLYRALPTLHRTEPNLFWVHSMAPRVFRDAAETGYVMPSRCSFFKRDLIYLFYGRPAYRFGYDGSMRAGQWAPCVIVFRPTIESFSVQSHPFDTGAFLSGRYEQWIPREYDVADFELPSSCGAPAQCIQAFYGSNRNYWVGDGRKAAAYRGGELERVVLADMISDRAGAHADNRRLAIEMALATKVPIDREHVLALVVPDTLKDAPYVLPYSFAKNIPVFSYRLYEGATVMEHQVHIEEAVRHVHELNGAI